MTAGNSSALSDGASAVLLASEEWARGPAAAGARVPDVLADRGRRFRPRWRGPADGAGVRGAADARTCRAERSATSTSTRSTKRSRRRCWRRWRRGRTRSSRAAQLGLDDAARGDRPGPAERQRSSLAAGHPFAATGGRVVATLAKLLAEKGAGRGLISICAAGGQGRDRDSGAVTSASRQPSSNRRRVVRVPTCARVLVS